MLSVVLLLLLWRLMVVVLHFCFPLHASHDADAASVMRRRRLLLLRGRLLGLRRRR
jgi:hypothetical protein